MGITEVRLHKLHIDTVLEIVRSLGKQGLKQEEDFDWAYHPGRWDPMTGDEITYVNFNFYKDELATWFKLQHGSHT